MAGNYNVSLTVENGGKRVNKIFISDIFPTVSMGEIDGICEVNKTFVELSVDLPIRIIRLWNMSGCFQKGQLMKI